VILKTQTMNQHFQNEQGMTEIIFAQRNKAYGAYQIRSHYGETTLKSLGFMLLSVSLLMGIAFQATRPNEPEPEEKPSPLFRDSIFVIPFSTEELKPETVEKNVQTKKAEGSELSTTTSTLVLDSAVLRDVISSSVAVTSTSTAQSEGTDGKGDLGGTALDSTTAGTGGIKSKPVKNGFEVDQMPRFKGGLKALNDFIRLNVRYPETAVEENRSGTVYVRFVVDEKGKVVDAELLNRLGQDLNGEALRVIGMIPDFESPGISKGEPVKTYYQLPISFRLR